MSFWNLFKIFTCALNISDSFQINWLLSNQHHYAHESTFTNWQHIPIEIIDRVANFNKTVGHFIAEKAEHKQIGGMRDENIKESRTFSVVSGLKGLMNRNYSQIFVLKKVKDFF